MDNVTGKTINSYPPYKRYVKQSVSAFVLGAFIVLTVTIVFQIFAQAAVLSTVDWLTPSQRAMVPTLAGIVNSVQIQIMNFIYAKLATKMNDMENYKLQSDYDNNLYIKTFGYCFLNTFTSMYYIAFFKHHIEGCAPSCNDELGNYVFILFICAIMYNTIELAMPLLDKWKAEMEQESGHVNVLETEYDTGGVDVNGDYLELMLTYGYFTLFSSSLPIATTFALVAMALEVKVDGFKYSMAA